MKNLKLFLAFLLLTLYGPVINFIGIHHKSIGLPSYIMWIILYITAAVCIKICSQLTNASMLRSLSYCFMIYSSFVISYSIKLYRVLLPYATRRSAFMMFTGLVVLYIAFLLYSQEDKKQ